MYAEEPVPRTRGDSARPGKTPASTGGQAGNKRRRAPVPPSPGFKGERQCTAYQDGARCAEEAAPGLQRCAYHYATDPHLPGRFASGRYASAFRIPELRDRFNDYKDAPDRDDPAREITLLQATVDFVVEKASGDEDSYARAAPEIARLLDTLTKMQERKVRIAIVEENSWGPADIALFAAAIATAINTHVRDPFAKGSLLDDISAFIRGRRAGLIEGEAVATADPAP